MTGITRKIQNTEVLLMKIKFNFETMQWEGITVNQVKIWEILYGDIDVVHEIRVEMVRWLDMAKGTNKVNKRNWKRFIVNWLDRKQRRAVI
jgi:hypothetical protein